MCAVDLSAVVLVSSQSKRFFGFLMVSIIKATMCSFSYFSYINCSMVQHIYVLNAIQDECTSMGFIHAHCTLCKKCTWYVF